MALWFFQLSETEYHIRNYRLHVWETERWRFFVRTMMGAGKPPEQGDIVVFFYAPTHAAKPDEYGFVGWGVVLQWIQNEEEREERELCFRVSPPSDFLKMHPWNDEQAIKIADKIRGDMTQRTLWPIQKDEAKKIRQGISDWLSGRSTQI